MKALSGAVINSVIKRTGFVVGCAAAAGLTLCLAAWAPAVAQNAPPSTQPAAVQICEQRYDANKAYSAAPLIIDGVSDRIVWPRPASCKRLTAYVTGANQVSDRDGENPLLIGTPWRDIDAARYRLVRDGGGLALQGIQGDTQPYNRWRFVVETRDLLRRLARADAERIAGVRGADGAVFDGPLIDNFNTCPFEGQGGSFRRLAGWEWVDHEWVRDCLAFYVHEFRLWYRLVSGRDAYIVVNVSRPQVWWEKGKPAPVGEAVGKMLGWLKAVGVEAVMVENPLKYSGAEGEAVRNFCAMWKATGKDLVLKQMKGSADLSGFAAALGGPNVYVSVDR